jgi:hypothetical protein
MGSLRTSYNPLRFVEATSRQLRKIGGELKQFGVVIEWCERESTI